MIRKLIIIVCPLIFTFRLSAQNFPGGFNFYLPPDDTTSQRFLPRFPVKAIAAEDFVQIDADGHLIVNKQPIRFWGVNAVADGAFPNTAKAWFIAGRLRKMGFNLVRFHHLDNPWSRESLFEWGRDTRHLNRVTLDRMEKFISELKKNGLYLNMNLHVSRTVQMEDGIVDADSIRDFGKGVSFFDPDLLPLYKEYAQQLLTHVNPYTGLSLANDPVMAMVEITNENSLYRMWRDGQLKPFSRGGNIMSRHSKQLDELWQNFLTSKYGNTENLRQAWDVGARNGSGMEMVKDGGFEHNPIFTYWQLEQHNPARGSMGMEVANPYAGKFYARVSVTQTDGIGWHIQWKQVGATIQKDSLYSVTFAARANENRAIYVSVMREVSPWTRYGGASFLLTPQWQTFSFSFRAAETCQQVTRLSFLLGESVGTYWFDEIHFTPSSIKGLMEGESLEERTVQRMDYSACATFTDARVMDMSAFYLKLQDDFFAEMIGYLKNVLQVRVPIVTTNWNVGPADLAVQSNGDYIDNHSYWDHPQFPNIPWSSTDWLINNTPMVRATDGGTIPALFGGVGFKNKPFTVSEYNHAFPNRYQSEGVLFLCSYASFHDVDGIMFFDYGSTVNDWESDRIDGYFDIHRNTAMMALMPACARAFRDHFISPAQKTLDLAFSQEDVLLLPKRDSGDWRGPQIFPRMLALQHALRNASFSSAISFDANTLPAEPSNPYTSDTGQIVWNTNGLLQTATERFIGLTGFLAQFPGHNIGDLQLISASDFATLTWISLTEQSLSMADRSLLTLASKTQNTNMIWDGTSTVHSNWGSSPTQLYPTKVTLRLHILADSIRIYPLNSRGAAGSSFTTYHPVTGQTFEVALDQNLNRTTWFGVERFGVGTKVHFQESDSKPPTTLALAPTFPNPFNATTIIKYELPKRTKVRIKIFNLFGQEISSLVDEEKEAGRYDVQWPGEEDQNRQLASGLYWVRLESEGSIISRKMLLIR